MRGGGHESYTAPTLGDGAELACALAHHVASAGPPPSLEDHARPGPVMAWSGALLPQPQV